MNFIYDYQSLIGSFLGVVFAVGFWYFKSGMEKKHTKENNKKEMENIFWMASRESEAAIKDIKDYINAAAPLLKKLQKEIGTILPPRISRIHINEERLFYLKYDLGFAISQQIDIAVSSAKRLNGYLDQIENMPAFMIDTKLKIARAGFISSKEEFLISYAADQNRYFQGLAPLLKDIEVAQRHILRPIAAGVHKKKILEDMLEKGMIDQILDQEADLLLVALKRDSKS